MGTRAEVLFGANAMTSIAEAAEPVRREEVLILDSSANMYTAYEGETRFERAVSRLRTQAEDVFADDGFVTVIVADGDAHYLLSQRLEADSRDALSAALDELGAQDVAHLGRHELGRGGDLEDALLLGELEGGARPLEVVALRELARRLLARVVDLLHVDDGDDVEARFLCHGLSFPGRRPAWSRYCSAAAASSEPSCAASASSGAGVPSIVTEPRPPARGESSTRSPFLETVTTSGLATWIVMESWTV